MQDLTPYVCARPMDPASHVNTLDELPITACDLTLGLYKWN